MSGVKAEENVAGVDDVVFYITLCYPEIDEKKKNTMAKLMIEKNWSTNETIEYLKKNGGW